MTKEFLILAHIKLNLYCLLITDSSSHPTELCAIQNCYDNNSYTCEMKQSLPSGTGSLQFPGPALVLART